MTWFGSRARSCLCILSPETYVSGTFEKSVFFLLSHEFKSSVRHNRLDLTSTQEHELSTVTRTASQYYWALSQVFRQLTTFRFPRKLLRCLMLYCEPVLVTVCDSSSCVDVKSGLLCLTLDLNPCNKRKSHSIWTYETFVSGDKVQK